MNTMNTLIKLIKTDAFHKCVKLHKLNCAYEVLGSDYQNPTPCFQLISAYHDEADSFIKNTFTRLFDELYTVHDLTDHAHLPMKFKSDSDLTCYVGQKVTDMSIMYGEYIVRRLDLKHTAHPDEEQRFVVSMIDTRYDEPNEIQFDSVSTEVKAHMSLVDMASDYVENYESMNLIELDRDLFRSVTPYDETEAARVFLAEYVSGDNTHYIIFIVRTACTVPLECGEHPLY